MNYHDESELCCFLSCAVGIDQQVQFRLLTASVYYNLDLNEYYQSHILKLNKE